MTAARRTLGKTDLSVYPLNLGGNVFGWTCDCERSFAVLDAYREQGGNFIDTANSYSVWVTGHRGGESEELIGEWLRSRKAREMIVATKVGSKSVGLEPGLTAAQLRKGCEDSLKRLGVERLELLYAHRDDPKTPVEETLAAFDALVREGKVRWIGASNFTAERLRESLDASARHGWASYAVFQPEYSLVARESFEGPLADLCLSRGLGTCTYYALASGFLTGKYREGDVPTSARAGGVKKYLESPKALATLKAVREIAGESRATMAQVALAWLLAPARGHHAHRQRHLSRTGEGAVWRGDAHAGARALARLDEVSAAR